MSPLPETKESFDHIAEIAVNHEGETEAVRIKEIPYSIYKAARPLLKDNPDKAISLFVKNCVVKEDQAKCNKWIQEDKLVPVMSLEEAFGQLLMPMDTLVKKNLKNTKLTSTKKTTE